MPWLVKNTVFESIMIVVTRDSVQNKHSSTTYRSLRPRCRWNQLHVQMHSFPPAHQIAKTRWKVVTWAWRVAATTIHGSAVSFLPTLPRNDKWSFISEGIRCEFFKVRDKRISMEELAISMPLHKSTCTCFTQDFELQTPCSCTDEPQAIDRTESSSSPLCHM